MPGNVNLILKIDGKDTLMPYLTAFSYTEAVGELDGLTATVMFPNSVMDVVQPLLEPGHTFKLELYENKAKVTEREGDIIAVSFYRRRQGIQATLIGVNYLHRLRTDHVTEIWEKAHDAIVKAVAGRAKPSLTPKVQGIDATPEVTFQQNETDAVFLMRLAREHNYYCRVVAKELHFGRRDMAYGAAVTIAWHNDFVDIRLTANLKDHLNEVQVYWGDHEKDGTKDTKVTYAKAPTATNATGKLGLAIGETKFGKKTAVIGGMETPYYMNQSLAKAKAKADLDAAAMDFIEGVVTCFKGQPKAACGAKLTIKDAGWPFEGKFIITKVEHRRSHEGTFSTDITFKANSLPKP
jgi:phage protein D